MTSNLAMRHLPRRLACIGAMLSLGACSYFESFTDNIGLTRPEVTLADIEPLAPKMPPRRPAERDVEKPGVFQMKAEAVWDGRPTFGKVWIAVADADQPERVTIRNEATGQTIRGSMLVAGADQGAPIRLSSGAAVALGVGMSNPVELTVTALRTEVLDTPAQPSAPDVRETTIPPMPIRAALDQPPVLEEPRRVASQAPSLYPAPGQEDGFVEVAQSLNATSAARVREELSAAEIPAEVQQDVVDGNAVYRVFASNNVPENRLYRTLAEIQFVSEAEGSDDGSTIIAEIPNFSTMKEPEGTGAVWVEFGAYPSRNEALAVTQRLLRRDIPTEICETQRGLLKLYRVFSGPAGEESSGVDAHSFCFGVAAADAVRTEPAIVDVTATKEAPADVRVVPVDNSTAVRIKVGEATGDLNFAIPNMFSKPYEIEVDGIVVTVPATASPETLSKIEAALEGL